MSELVAATVYRAVMWAGHLVCHQMPARSPHLFGVQFPLCWRCSGILFGSFAFLVWLFWKRRLPALRLCIALSLPMLLDVLCNLLTRSEGDNARRLATGTLSGFFATALALHLFTRLASRQLNSRSTRYPSDAKAAHTDATHAATVAATSTAIMR